MKITVRTKEKRFPVAPSLYGLFFEDINRSGDGGLYPEMLRNRAFEDSIPPLRVAVSEDQTIFRTPEGFVETFCHGEGAVNWIRRNQTPYTPIPAWYAESAVMELDRTDTLNSKREAALLVDFAEGGCIYNIGYVGLRQEFGEAYHFMMFAKANKLVPLTVAVVGERGVVYGRMEFVVSGEGYRRYDAVYTASQSGTAERLVLTAPEGGQVKFGFTSLKPVDTYKGHGLRRDLVEMLKALNPKFLRFPGGCIVEGFTRETAMRFPNTIGPEWERPSHTLMWHYRTTNGLGFHEFLQLCEDLSLEPMYVFNCGLSCQGRFPECFSDEEVDLLIQETLDAIEYAIGPADSMWGRKRAQAGHEAPFAMRYIEIGNENFGPAYCSRYKKCYETLKAQYPELIYISNTHTEQNNLPTQVVDEHFYDSAEFFAEELHRYDSYDRSGPEIFVGEFAVTVGAPEKLYAALGEAMFMIGMERNQDIVKLSSYAPLLANSHYVSWGPNLICFDQHRFYGLPSYYVWKLFGNHRGDTVVETEDSVNLLYYPVRGLPAVMGDAGLQYRCASWNGRPIAPSHEILGSVTEKNGICTTVAGEPVGVHPYMADKLREKAFIVLGNDEAAVDGIFEIELFAEEGRELMLGLFCEKGEPVVHWTNHSAEPEPWSLSSVLPFKWLIRGGQSSVLYGRLGKERIAGDPVKVTLNYGTFNVFRAELSAKSIRLSINGKRTADVPVPQFTGLASTASETADGVILKIVNMSPAADDVRIILDCDVAPEYMLHIVTGDPMGKNSFEEPENIRDYSLKKSGASRSFIYNVPGSSISVLELKKRRGNQLTNM